MKTTGLAFLIVLSLAAVSCGKKSSGGGSDSSSLSSSNSASSTDCLKDNSITYKSVTATINWGTGEIKIGKATYSASQVSPNSVSVITTAYQNKGNVSGRTDGQTNAYGQVNIVYKATIKAALVPSTLAAGYSNVYNNVYGTTTGTTTSSSSCMLDIQTAKFRNY